MRSPRPRSDAFPTPATQNGRFAPGACRAVALPRRWRLPLLWLLIVAALAAGSAFGSRSRRTSRASCWPGPWSSGQWLLPHRGVELYAEKPPVFMWLQAAYEIVGSWQWSFLLPSLLGALLSLWLVSDLAATAAMPWRRCSAPCSSG